MSANTIVRNAALSQPLHTVSVYDLQIGMFVHAVGDQVGKLGVKNKGEVRHLGIIDQLAASGVKSVVVEYLNQSATLSKDKRAQRKAKVSSLSLDANELEFNNDSHLLESNLAYINAAELLKQNKLIYSKFKTAINNGESVDFTQSKALIADVQNALLDNPDALLCMSMVMHSSEYIANHAIHVATLMYYFAQHLSYSKEECEKLALVGYLLDVGMLKLPDSICQNTAALSQSEHSELESHVQHTLDIIAPLKLESEYLLAIEQHHERLDGSGYPSGYTDTKIHKFSRLLAIVDCYDALTTMRPHQMPLPPAAAMRILSSPENGYDQKLALRFIRCMGIYPVGSLVALSNKLIGLVTKTHMNAPNSPEVKVFYNSQGNHFVSPYLVDLHQCKNSHKPQLKDLKVIKPVLASQFGFDLEKII